LLTRTASSRSVSQLSEHDKWLRCNDHDGAILLGSRNVRIRYQTTSLQGGPEFHYEDGRLSVDRRGEEIRAKYASIGQLVTIVTEQVPDLEAVLSCLQTYSLK
jgi:hypothetical protein